MTRVEEGQVSRVYGARASAPVAVVETEGETSELISFLIPARESLSIEQTAGRVDGSAYRISSGESFDVALAGNDASDLESGSLRARGSFAWARFSCDRFICGCLIRGSKFEVAGRIKLHSPVAFRWCAVRMNDGCVEITIHGGSRFDLSFTQPPDNIVVNEAPFSLSRNRTVAAFVRQGSGWTLMGSD